MSIENKSKRTDKEKEDLIERKKEEQRIRNAEIIKTVEQQAKQFTSSLQPKKLKDFVQVPVSYMNLLETVAEYSLKGFDPIIVVPFPQQTYIIFRKRKLSKSEEIPEIHEKKELVIV